MSTFTRAGSARALPAYATVLAWLRHVKGTAMKLVRLAGPVALLVGLLAPVASVSAASAISVHPGQSIQAGINRAPSGGVVVVERGTYKGNLEITRSVSLLGHDAIIVPSAKPAKNGCTDSTGAAGICVHGTINADNTPGKAVSNVSIEGFTIRNFPGGGIVAANTANFRAVRNVTTHNGLWGIEVGVSSGVALLNNRSYDNGSDGIRVDYSSTANAVAIGNASYLNLGAGISFVGTLGGRIALNATYGNCGGIVAAVAGNLSIQLNQVTGNNRWCPAVPAMEEPAYGGFGIGLLGAQNTVVSLNDVEGNVSQVGSFVDGGGIVLYDGTAFGGTPPAGNSIRLNVASGNGPNDVFGDGSGSGNTISGNSCTIASPASAC